ncbi:MAG TPA: glycoside hydrolase family 88 protein [Verrucomicrobiae bacterium]
MKSFPSLRAGLVAAIFFAANFQLRAQFLTGALPTQDLITTNNSSAITPQSVLAQMQRVGDWQLAHSATERTTGWIQAVGDVGMMALAGISGDPKYRDAMLAKGETNGWQLAEYRGRKYHADDQCYGQVCAELYFLYRENRMIGPMREKFDWILANPPANPSLDHKFGENQWTWCDALFMAPPAWLRLYAATDDTCYLDFAVTNFWRTTDYLYDKDEHLFYRDSSFFDKREANGRKIFWSRGNGWVLAATVRMLQFLPMNNPDRPRFEKLFKDMAEKILSCQQPDGMWSASLLDPDDFPTPEASGSALFTYGLAWGVNQGLLDRATYEPAVRKAWPALLGCVDADGKLTHIQPAGDHPVKFDADSTQPYGGGVFLLAGSEVYKMAVLNLPAVASKAADDVVIPLIEFDAVPVTQVIDAFARTAKIEYILDPKIGYGQIDQNKNTKNEPLITVRWANLSCMQALQMTLDSVGLMMEQDSQTKKFNIVESSKDIIPIVSSPIIVKIKNPSGFQRNCETVELNIYNKTTNDWSFVKDKSVVMDGLSARILDSQIYSPKTNSSPDKLLFQVDLAPGETRTFYILDSSALPAVPPPIVKTFARYVPERYDDFAWESDRIAHRAYGQALIKAEGTITSGPDVWIKSRRNLMVNEMYASGHYHMDNGDEMDDYRVGHSRGCGGLGIWDGTKLYTSSNYRNWKLITTGPIRSEFELTYDAWDAGNGRMVSETKRYSIDAGSYFTKAQSTFASDDKSPLTIGVGLAERACPTNREEFFARDLSEGWLAYWQPEDKPKGIIGDAIILAKGSVLEFTNDAPDLSDSKLHANVPQPTHEGYPPIRDQLAITKAEVGQPLTYYFGACWDRSGDFTNHIQWENYVKRFAERRDEPLQVTVGN